MWLRDLTGKRITESTKKIINLSSRLSAKGICVEMCLLILRVRKQAPSAHIRGWMCFQCCAMFFNTHSGSGFTLSVCICTANTPLPLGNTHLAATTRTAGNHELVTSWLTESCVINTIDAPCIWRVTMTGGACLIYFLCSKINRPTSFLNMHF